MKFRVIREISKTTLVTTKSCLSTRYSLRGMSREYRVTQATPSGDKTEHTWWRGCTLEVTFHVYDIISDYVMLKLSTPGEEGSHYMRYMSQWDTMYGMTSDYLLLKLITPMFHIGT